MGLLDQKLRGLLDYIQANTPRNTQPKADWRKVIDEGLINPTPGNLDNANRFKDSAFGLAGIVPGVGDYASGVQAADFWNRGEKGNAVLAGLGALPIVPSLVGAGATLGGLGVMHGVAQKIGKPMISGPGRNQAGAIVYHGSPHKFNKFDMSKIGTGEGAQAYGHGLYMAESPAVAQSYADVLGDSKLLVNGKPFEAAGNTTQATAVRAIAAQGYDESIKAAKQMLDEGADPNWVKNYMYDLNKLKGQDIRYETTGNLYKVDIPDESIPRMLDWDKPLSEQNVMPALRNPAMQKGMADAGMGFESMKLSGNEFYNRLARGIGQDEASNLMKQAGIPGIRYLDGNSRGSGGTSNFVLFDDQLPRILETNGVPTGLLSYADEAAQKARPPTQYELAHQTAQKNAVDMLGLPHDNTAMDRARAMGFEGDWLHGSAKRGYVESTDIKQFDKSKIGDSYNADRDGFFVTNHPTEANYYSSADRDYYNKGEGEGAIYPLLMRTEKPMEKVIPKTEDTVSYWDNNNQTLIDAANKLNADSVILEDVTNGRKMGVAFEPNQLRSRFAAFDPAKRDSSDLLAGVAPYAIPALGAGLLGAAMMPDEAMAAEPKKKKRKQ